ncbi:MAG: carboxypeptidase M32 [Clostridia bacterium]
MKELLKKYEAYRREIITMQFVSYLINWDSTTEAPDNCFGSRSECMGVISEKDFKYQTSKENVELINMLYERRDEITDAVLKHEIEVEKRELDDILKMPMELVVEMDKILSQSAQIWAKAKNSSDFTLFAPTLERIIEIEKEMIKHLETDKCKGYDVLLNRFAYGMNMAQYDVFFNDLRRELVPFVKAVTSKKIEGDFGFANQSFPIEKQREFCKYIMDVMCFDKTRGIMKESEHPFTSGFGNSDVRVTVHYYPELFISSIYSAIHELGHATYEQQVSDDLELTMSGGCRSLALHESQSRFYENILGRSHQFWETHFGKLKEIFADELKDVTLEQMYKFVNISENTFIRTEADELTYSLHIMLRYQIEREIFEEGLKVADLPRRWNELMKEYLNLDVKSDKEGVLQDVHWSGAMFGYFPTYALGSAYSAQIFDTMNKDFDVLESLKNGNMKQVNNWLKEHLHKFGASKEAKELFENTVGKPFDAMYYVNYLKEKYGKIYNI